MKQFVHILILATFLLGGFLSSPAAHAFDGAGSLNCITADCEQIELSDSQGTDDTSPNQDQIDQHLCGHSGHGCHHSHFIINTFSAFNLALNKNKQFNTDASVVINQFIYSLKRPPRTLA